MLLKSNRKELGLWNTVPDFKASGLTLGLNFHILKKTLAIISLSWDSCKDYKKIN